MLDLAMLSEALGWGPPVRSVVDRVWSLPFSPIPDGKLDPAFLSTVSAGLGGVDVLEDELGEKSPVLG